MEFELLEEPTESPISELREDVVDAVSTAVNARYPEVKLIAYMESGGTDGMHFRRAGIPTWAVSGIFMDPDEMYAHGLNERVPIKAFYDAWITGASLSDSLQGRNPTNSTLLLQ